LKVLLATYDLQPPWDSGHKVYGKGLLDCIQRIEGADATVIRALDKSVKDIEDKYDFVHVILTGSKPLVRALRIFKKAMIFKHILTPSIGFRSSFNTRIYYSLMEMFQNRLIRCFSSDSVAESYFMNARLIIPPPTDTSVFVGSPRIQETEVLKILEDSPVKVGVANINCNANSLMLYSGPLTEDRFPYQMVLKSVVNTKSKILIVGRTSNGGPAEEKVREILDFSRKLGIENKVTIVLKTLNEVEKIKLINFSDFIIQPFANHRRRFVAVDPPFFLLESMACEKPVITSKTYSLERLINNGKNGYIIDWSDPTELDRALTDCISSKHVAAKARETILQNFSLELVSQKLKKSYDSYQ